jgi:hypothetical protein
MNKKSLQILSVTTFALIGFAGSGNCDTREQCLEKCSEKAYAKFQKCPLHHNFKPYEKCIPDLIQALQECLFDKCPFGEKPKSQKKK